MKTYAVIYSILQGTEEDTLEKLVGAESESEAVESFERWYYAEIEEGAIIVHGARLCNKDDEGQFFMGLKTSDINHIKKQID